MKKIILIMAIAAVGLGACEKRPQPLTIDTAPTDAEIAAGVMTPEVMWMMSPEAGATLAPDGRTLPSQQPDNSRA